MSKIVWVVIGVIVVVLIIFGILSTRSNSNKNVQSSTVRNVSIKNIAFNPSKITVAKGTTIIWTNNDSATHTVTSNNDSFTSSGDLAPGASYEVTFKNTGNYGYFCSIHSQMTGQIIVQ